MDGVSGTTLVSLVIFLVATFAGAVVAGVAGFAFGLVAAAIWLYVLTPIDSAALIVGFGLVVQGVAVWKLRHALDPRRLWPFVAGGALGVPLGVVILGSVPPDAMRAGIGVFLVAYALHGLARPAMRPLTVGGAAADGGIGVLGGIVGGATGLAGIVPTIWCGIRGWPKDVQRAVFQPVAVAIFVMTALWLGGRGIVTAGTIKLFLVGLPPLLAGTWVGFKLYGRLDEAAFRKVVLALLILSGALLIVR